MDLQVAAVARRGPACKHKHWLIGGTRIPSLASLLPFCWVFHPASLAAVMGWALSSSDGRVYFYNFKCLHTVHGDCSGWLLSLPKGLWPSHYVKLPVLPAVMCWGLEFVAFLGGHFGSRCTCYSPTPLWSSTPSPGCAWDNLPLPSFSLEGHSTCCPCICKAGAPDGSSFPGLVEP